MDKGRIKKAILKIKYVFVFLLIAGFLSSCGRYSKGLLMGYEYKPNKDMISIWSKKNEDISTYSAKFKLNSSSYPELDDFKGVIRISRDSIIWINLSLSNGITVAKAMFTPDGFQVYNRMEKELIQGNYTDFNEKYKLTISFNLLQSLILNEPYPNQSGKYKIKTIQKKDIPFLLFQYPPNSEGLVCSYMGPKKEFKLSNANFVLDKNILNIDYSNFNESDDHIMPEQYQISWQSSSDLNEVQLELSRIEINKRLRFPFKVPNKYE